MNVLLRKNMQLIDTNVILRFVLNDNVEMAQRAADVIASGAYTKPEGIAEVVRIKTQERRFSTPPRRCAGGREQLNDMGRT